MNEINLIIILNYSNSTHIIIFIVDVVVIIA
jgi:hypothetical protein